MVNSVLLKALPYPEDERLVAVWHAAPGAAGLASVSGGLRLSPSMYMTYPGQNRTFQAFGVWMATTTNVTGLAEPQQARTVVVSDGVLQALNVAPVLGRWLGRMFVRYAATLASIGAAVGLAAAIGLTRLMKSLLFGISPMGAGQLSAGANPAGK